jgi:hypothetical protein
MLQDWVVASSDLNLVVVPLAPGLDYCISVRGGCEPTKRMRRLQIPCGGSGIIAAVHAVFRFRGNPDRCFTARQATSLHFSVFLCPVCMMMTQASQVYFRDTDFLPLLGLS